MINIDETTLTLAERDAYKLDLNAHIRLQQKFTAEMVSKINEDSESHDASKLIEPEYSFYMKLNKALKPIKYGSPEYKDIMQHPMVSHHQKNNSHHPEYYDNGVNGMNLIDVVNMLADWKAASMRSDTPFIEGLKKNKERFGIDNQLYDILENTVKLLGW